MAGVGVEAGVGKILPTPTPTRSRKIHTTPQQTVILVENTERLQEKESGSVEIKLSVIHSDRIRSQKSIEDNFRASRALCELKDCGTDHIQRNQR